MNRKHYKVLIIDDSAADRRIYRRFLQGQQGYELDVFEAETAESGLARFAQIEPDCVILDYRLPDLDGLKVLEVLQERAAGYQMKNVPVIFVTGQPEALLVSEAYRRGAVKYISKDTITSAVIQDAVNDALDVH